MTLITSSDYDYLSSLFRAGRIKEAVLVIDSAIEASPLSEESLHLRLIKARAIEYGEWGSDHDQGRAYQEYSLLEPWAGVLGMDGLNVYLGAARTLYRMDRVKNAGEIERLLDASLVVGKSPYISMLRGLLNETVFLKNNVARRYYLEAFKMGAPWGLRYYARSHTAERHFIRGWAAHISATVLSPLMIMMFGAKGVLHENPRL